MAKKGFDYFPADVDMFQDRKIRRLLRFAGGEGFTIYIYLLTEIYRGEGYFLKWDEGSIFDVSDHLNLPEETVKKSVEKCCELGLFHAELLSKMGVISSESIQKRYLKISVQAKRKDIEIIDKFKIVDGEMTYFNECKKIDSEEKRINSEEITISSEEKRINSEESTQSKVKESKVKESKGDAHAREHPQAKKNGFDFKKNDPGERQKKLPPDLRGTPPHVSRGSPVEIPTLPEVVQFFRAESCPLPDSEAKLFLNHYASAGWKDRSGNRIDWTAKARSWIIRTEKYHKENQSNGKSRKLTGQGQKRPDPEKVTNPLDYWGKL